MALHDEKHWRISELALRWGVSPKTVRRMFADEPGLLRLAHPSRREDRILIRRYQTMTTPASVAERVYMRLSRVGK